MDSTRHMNSVHEVRSQTQHERNSLKLRKPTRSYNYRVSIKIVPHRCTAGSSPVHVYVLRDPFVLRAA